MDREIKFRAWDDERNKFVSDFRLEIAPNNNVKGVVWTNSDEGIPHGVIVTIMQYTGLKDKNGKEIYEGDILSVIDNGGERFDETYYPVVWGEYSDGEYVYAVQCWLVGSMPLSEARQGSSYMHSSFDVEIVGNIYENPELLENG